jgi:proline iminopeptidase
MLPNNSLTIPESAYTAKYTLDEILFPKIEAHTEGRLKVSELHEIWYGEYGNPKGMPVVFLHGGPGAGCGPNDMRFFDPEFYRIILFDQRGTKRSTPFSEIKENNTQHLIADIEKLRLHLQIEKWLVFGGSWGSALAVLYGEAYPTACLGFVLRGIFLGTQEELENVYAMNDIFPDLHDELRQFIPLEEQNDLLTAYHKRLFDIDPAIAIPAAKSFTKYDLMASFLMHSAEKVEPLLQDEKFVLGLSRLFTHYAINHCFVEEAQIISDLPKIHHLPAIIVQGRYDIICRPKAAYKLHQDWAGSKLVLVQDAGHASIEPGVAKALVGSTEEFKRNFENENSRRASTTQ